MSHESRIVCIFQTPLLRKSFQFGRWLCEKISLGDKIKKKKQPHKRKISTTPNNNNKMDLDELPPPKEEKKSSPVGEAIFLLICTFIMVSTRSIDFVLYVRMATKMRNYTYILADILLSLGFIFGMLSLLSPCVCCVDDTLIIIRSHTRLQREKQTAKSFCATI